MSGRIERAVRAGVTIVAVVSCASAAHAEPTPADRETARALMADGRQKRDQGDLAGALVSFRAAHKLMNFPTTGREVGITEAALGLLIEARDTLLAVTRMPVTVGEAAGFAAARAEAAELAESIAPRIPAAKFHLSGAPVVGAARFLIDGIDTPGLAPELPRKINPGSHTVAVRTDDAEGKATFVLAEGQTSDVDIVLVAAPRTTTPGATPLRDTPAASGYTWTYVGFGVAGAALVVGGISGLMHFSKTKDLEASCPGHRCGPDASEDYKSASRMATVSTLSFVVAGVGAAIGVYDLLRSHQGSEAPKPTAARARIVIGFGQLGLDGTF